MSRFYVGSERSVSARFAAELAIAPTSTHLLVGGVGSGKTTELLATERNLANTDVTTLYLDVTKLHDIAKMTPGAVLAQVALGFANQLEGVSDSPGIRLARDVANGAWEDYGYPYEGEDGRYVPGILVPPDKFEENAERARMVLEALLKTIRPAAKHVVVFLDGLDRIADLQAFDQLVVQDIKILSSLGIGVVLVGPLRALYGLDRVLVERFDTFQYQPWIDITRDASARRFLTDVLRKRAGDAFDESAIDPLVAGSGGVLRDLLALAQSALVDAYMNGATQAGLHEANSAIDAFGRKHLYGLRPKELDVLQRVRTNGHFVQTSEDDLALLMTRRVLEYRSQEQLRYAVHPTIDVLLQQIGL